MSKPFTSFWRRILLRPSKCVGQCQTVLLYGLPALTFDRHLYSKRMTRQTRPKQSVKRQGDSKLLCLLRKWPGVLSLIVVLGSFVFIVWSQQNPKMRMAETAAYVGNYAPEVPPTLNQLLVLSSSEIERCDIALLNLLCTQGLPGTEGLNITNCLLTLHEWARHVQSETERNIHQFLDHPADFNNSEGYFRMLMMSVVMYDDFSIRYNPARIVMPGVVDPNDHFFADSRDVFLHGLVGGRRMGTCSSMPVLYIAIGRRLGYPLKLVTTKAHLFVRWEGDTDRFDVEATGKGMNRYDDEHFKQWPFPVTESEIRAEGYLKSLTASEELAVFLSLRGNCLKEAGRKQEAVVCYAKASELAPSWNAYRALLADTEASSVPSPSATKHMETPQPRGVADLGFQ